MGWLVAQRNFARLAPVFASIQRRQKAAVLSGCLSFPPLTQHVCGREHDARDKREHARKQHNVDDELYHHTPPLVPLALPIIEVEGREAAPASAWEVGLTGAALSARCESTSKAYGKENRCSSRAAISSSASC